MHELPWVGLRDASPVHVSRGTALQYAMRQLCAGAAIADRLTAPTKVVKIAGATHRD